MKDYKFFAEFENASAKRKGNSKNGFAGAVNCVAVATWNRGRMSYRQGKHGQEPFWVLDAVSSVYSHADSHVSGSDVSRDYIQENCKRCSEAEARKIHPTLFQALDNEAKENVAEKGCVIFNWNGEPRKVAKVYHVGRTGAYGRMAELKECTSLTQFWRGRAPSWWVQFEDGKETAYDFVLSADLVKSN